MSQPLLILAFSLGATLPAATLAWVAGIAADRLNLTARTRALVWRAGLGLTLLAGLVVPLGLLRHPAARIVARHVTTVAPAGGAVTGRSNLPSHMDWNGLLGALAAGLVFMVLAGAAVGLALVSIRALRASRLPRKATGGEVLAPLVAQHAAALGIAPPPVLFSQTVSTAMLVGLRRPAILLPPRLLAEMETADLAWICAHELAHLKRGDNWRVLLDQLLGALLWFNPPALAALGRLGALREELCDAAVLADAPAADRRRYAAILLQALRLAGSGNGQPAFIHKQGSEHAVRFKAILQPRSRSSRLAMAGVAGALGAAVLSTGLVSAAFAQQLGAAASDDRAVAAKARYRQATAIDYQRYCASGDPQDDGFCAGVMFAVLPGGTAANPGNAICQPEKADYVGFEKQVRAAILAAQPNASETPHAFVVRVLRSAFQCQTPGVMTASGMEITSGGSMEDALQTIYTGSPTIRIVGPMPRQLLLVNGARPPEDFDVNAIPNGGIDRIIRLKPGNPQAAALGARPDQAVLNIVLKAGT